MTAIDLQGRLTTTSGLDMAQGDPNDSLGGFRSSTEIQDFDGTITTVGDELHFTDNAHTAESNIVGSWIILYDTPNINFATKVVAYSAGFFTVFPAMPDAGMIGDAYRLYRPNGLFNATSAALSSSRPNRFRMVHYLNDASGAPWTDISCAVVDHDPGPLALDIASANFDTSTSSVTAIASETTAPNITTSADGFITGTSAQVFDRPPLSADLAVPRQGSPRDLANNGSRAMWLRPRFVEDVPPRPHDQCAFQVFVFSADTPADIGSFMVVLDVTGPDLTVTAGPDRALRIAGGARVQAEVDETATGDAVPGFTTVFKLDSPSPGTLAAPNQDVTTTDGVINGAVYTSPTDTGQEGTNVSFTIEVH